MKRMFFLAAMKATFCLQQGQDQLAAGMVLFLLGLVTRSHENGFTVLILRN
jgi:hypothetical protein